MDNSLRIIIMDILNSKLSQSDYTKISIVNPLILKSFNATFNGKFYLYNLDN